jgi:hypothetical protein
MRTIRVHGFVPLTICVVDLSRPVFLRSYVWLLRASVIGFADITVTGFPCARVLGTNVDIPQHAFPAVRSRAVIISFPNNKQSYNLSQRKCIFLYRREEFLPIRETYRSCPARSHQGKNYRSFVPEEYFHRAPSHRDLPDNALRCC